MGGHSWSNTQSSFQQTFQRSQLLLQKISNETFTSFLLSLDITKDTNYSLWSVAKAPKKHSSNIPPLRSSNNTWARSDLEKAEVFANYLENIFKTNAMPSDVIPVLTKNAGNKIRLTFPFEIRKQLLSWNSSKHQY